MKAISMSADPPLRRVDPVTVARPLGWTSGETIDDHLSRSAGIARPQPSPIDAGAYAFGGQTSRLSGENGCKHFRRGVHRPMVECDVPIKSHHKPYVGGEALVLAAKPI